MKSCLILFVFFSCLIEKFFVESHSWIACTDYAEKFGKVWNPNKCRGFARSAHKKIPKTGVFGGDTGFDHIPNEDNACQSHRNDATEYNYDHPMAVYYPGQQVILVHPMKNHGADAGCTNIHIPDNGNWVYRTDRGRTVDPSLSTFQRKLVFNLGRSRYGSDFKNDHSLSSVYPKPGFQNAPLFCEDTDKAMATYVMNVPKDLKPGIYTFMWMWAFNSAKNMYSTCFEVQIVRNKVARDQQLVRNGFTDTTEPCGGMTSNERIKGNSNEGCTPILGDAGIFEYTYAEMPKTPAPTTTAAPYYHRPNPTYYRPATAAATTRSPYPIVNEYNKVMKEYENEKGISGVNSNIELAMTMTQFTGEIKLPAARSTAVRRYFAVDFNCDVEIAQFWNCHITNDHEIEAPNSPRRHYELLQEGDRELRNLHIYYHVIHREPCDIIRFPPQGHIIREEYKNL